MISVGDKFIIEIDKVFEQDGENLYRIKGFKSLVFDEYGLKMLRRFQDEYRVNIEAAHIAGQDEVWKLAKNLYYNVSPDEIREIFEIPTDLICIPLNEAMEKFTANEAINRYNEFMKANPAAKDEAEIKVGDVVKHKYKKYSETGVAIKVSDSCIYGLTSNGYRFEWSRSNCIKTGKNIDIESFLAQIEEV